MSIEEELLGTDAGGQGEKDSKYWQGVRVLDSLGYWGQVVGLRERG